VSGSRRQNKNIARVHGEFVAAGTTENDLPITTCDSKHFVRRGMVVMKIVNTVPPLRRPSIARENLLES
jgi:hypothetical protein